MSQPVAPCADFSGVVERVPTKQASGGIWAVLRRNLPWGKQPQIGWLRLRFGCRIKGRGCKAPSPGSQQPAMRTAQEFFDRCDIRMVRGCKSARFPVSGLQSVKSADWPPACRRCSPKIRQTGRKENKWKKTNRNLRYGHTRIRWRP